MKTAFIKATLLLCLLFLAAPLVAEHPEAKGYLGSFAEDFEGVNDKILKLAEATPAEKFAWRPSDEVRSISEVYIHTAAANFFLASSLGVAMPEDFGRDAEKTITSKDDVIATFKKSIEHVHKAAEAKAGGDLDAEVEVFGSKRPVRGVFMILSGHAHEHLGQSIAYARMAGVVPPWSQGGGGGSN